MGRRPITKSEDVFTPTSDKFLAKASTNTESSVPLSEQLQEPTAPESDEDGHLGAPEDYIWGLASG